jgi:hypothetical protein
MERRREESSLSVLELVPSSALEARHQAYLFSIDGMIYLL